MTMKDFDRLLNHTISIHSTLMKVAQEKKELGELLGTEIYDKQINLLGEYLETCKEKLLLLIEKTGNFKNE